MPRPAIASASCLLFALGLAPTARGTSVWVAGTGSVTGLGTDSVTISNASATTLTLDLQLDVDSRGIDGLAVGVFFDTDLENELDVLSFREVGWSNPKGTRTLVALGGFKGISSSQESTSSVRGELIQFDGNAMIAGAGPMSTTLTFARIVFVTNPARVQSDGGDVFRIPYVGGVFSNDLVPITSSVTFGAAGVNVIPEPVTFSLFGLGIACLARSVRHRPRPW